MGLNSLIDTPPWTWPEEAGRTIRKVLTDRASKPKERMDAADLAGDLIVMNDEMAAAILSVVKRADEPDELRARAALSLGPVLDQADLDGFEDPDDTPISESMFKQIESTLHDLYVDETQPKEVRRRIFEASVRAPQEWHEDAIRAAYDSGDREWILTAVFAMQWVPGFDKQILEALENTDPEIHTEALTAAGEQDVKGAWPHVAALLKDPTTPKDLLLAAIAASSTIMPKHGRAVLEDLEDSDDEEITEAVEEALLMADTTSDLDQNEDDDDDGDEPSVN